MSFSSDIKIELANKKNLKNKKEVYFELLGYLCTKNSKIVENKSIKYSTESEYNINRFAKLLNNININKYKIDYNNKSFTIKSSKTSENEILEDFNPYIETIKSEYEKQIKNEDDAKKLELDRQIICGAFLGAGSINDPNKSYHLEILCNNLENLKIVYEILERNDIRSKVIEDLNTIYIKDGENISNFLAFIGANTYMLKFEEVRVIKEVNNNINRIANCQTANIDKSLDASAKQLAIINDIRKKKLFNDLPDSLKEIILLREEHPEVSLEELGRLLSKPIGKSSVSHRFKKIEEFLKENK
jgi:hypothetical protein